MLRIGGDDPHDRPTVPEEAPPSPHVVVYHLIFFLGGGDFPKYKQMFYW